ncbi:MAG: hypothetical protein JF614_31690 [Acidobacteria bacterium]|nr:hypothetical protein [Acidobacteriota bacterium]
MQPVHGILASQVSQYFQQGRWEELERIFRDALKEDAADARSAFRLGNLLAYQGRYREALVCFETAWLYRWPGPIALNNRGVVFSCLGESRMAFKDLSDAARQAEGCRPASYNLGILCEKLGNEGSLPAVLLDLKLEASGKKASEIARSIFAQALDGTNPGAGWAETGPLDRPLFLWIDDLPSGFGFELKREIVNIEEAIAVYDEGISLVDQGRWQEGISKLDASAGLHPDLKERIKAPKTRALVGMVRSRFEEIRNKWDAEDFEGAKRGYDELIQLVPILPDRAFADEIVTAALNHAAERIRSHKPEEGWEALQRLITAARQRVEDDLRNGETETPEEEEIPGLEKTPEPEAAQEKTAGEEGASENETGKEEPPSPAPSNGAVREGPAAEHIRQVCRQAWGQQITYLLGRGEYEVAIDLLEFSDIEWFASRDLPGWRRRVYTSQAESLRTKGRAFFKKRKWKEAATCWKDGREAALLAEDAHVVESLDQLIDELLESAPAELQTELQALLRDRNDREALRHCVEALEKDPGDGRLTARRQALISQLLRQTQEALEAQQWNEAQGIANAILAAVPEESRARHQLRMAEEKLIEQWSEEAKGFLERGRLDDAAKQCAKIEALDPDHAGAREIRREIKIAERRAEQDKQDSNPYDKAFYAYMEARDAGDPERALEWALEMKRLDRRDPHTREALEWVPSAFVEALRVQLEKDRTPETANALTEKLKRLFSLQPNFKPARELSKELRQVSKGYDNQKRKRSYDKLGEAEEVLLGDDPDPKRALQLLAAVRDPDLEDEVQEKRKEALALLRGQIDELLADPSEENQKAADDLLKIHQRWDPSFVEARQREVERKQALRAEEKELDDQVKKLRDLLRQNKGKPFYALKEMDQTVRALDLEGSRIRTRRRREIEELRQRAKRNMTRWQRFKTEVLYDRYYKELPEPPASEGKGENR